MQRGAGRPRGAVEGVSGGGEGAAWSAPLAGRTWWSKKGFAIELERPEGFRFAAGQSIRIMHASQGRDYSIASGPDAPRLQLYLRLVEPGVISPWLAAAPSGTPVHFNGPSGLFIFRRSQRPAVLVATGTGIAPFLSMVRAGLSGFTLLYGVRDRAELYGEEIIREAAARYVPCLSAGGGGTDAAGAPVRLFRPRDRVDPAAPAGRQLRFLSLRRAGDGQGRHGNCR